MIGHLLRTPLVAQGSARLRLGPPLKGEERKDSVTREYLLKHSLDPSLQREKRKNLSGEDIDWNIFRKEERRFVTQEYVDKGIKGRAQIEKKRR
jgi:hypothetical protein